MVARKILFVDRDGTIIAEPDDEQIDRYDKLVFVPGAIGALRVLRDYGYELVLISNQDGLGTASFAQADFDGPHRLMLDILRGEGVVFSDERICPHLPGDGCACRKPATGLVSDYLAADDWSRKHSAVIGDRQTDVAFAGNLGVRALRIGAAPYPDWASIAADLTRRATTGAVRRKTNETDITVQVDLDATSPTHIDTGIGFFDHMLEQLCAHGGFAVQLTCRGDLHIDEHHTVEDCALALGQALGQVIADKRGLGRYGFVVPMDEARAQVTLDLSGRAYTRFNVPLNRERVGGLPTEMVGHFFSSLSSAAGLTLHIDVTGDNDHHMIEAAFKGTGRALRQALARHGAQLPSTKGVL
jgi:imidazoleglycerol-phosphate dehydratase/histidinol-phosphatase